MINSGGFQHKALLYASERHFLDAAVSFVTDGLRQGAATLVVVDEAKIVRVRAALGADAEAVEFADMASIGRNPARIIPAWQAFVDRHAGRPLRGIGEPIWPGRSPDELVECRHHETLLNVAFGGEPNFDLLCPYDVGRLDPGVIGGARRTHPAVTTIDGSAASSHYDVDPWALFDEPLPAPPATAATLAFSSVMPVRRFLDEYLPAGLAGVAVADVLLAISEVATNSICHGGGEGELTVWVEPGRLVCQVDDSGRIRDPLVGRRAPRRDRSGGWGLWIVNQLASLVQIRTSDSATRVRLHFNVAMWASSTSTSPERLSVHDEVAGGGVLDRALDEHDTGRTRRNGRRGAMPG